MTNSVNFPHGIYKQSPVLGYWVNVSINHDCTDVVHCTLRGMFPIKLILNGCNAFSLWVFVWLSVINQNVVLETASAAGTNTEEIGPSLDQFFSPTRLHDGARCSHEIEFVHLRGKFRDGHGLWDWRLRFWGGPSWCAIPLTSILIGYQVKPRLLS